MLIYGKDIQNIVNIYHSANKIIQYVNEFDDNPDKIDTKTIDAIIFRLNDIGLSIEKTTEEFKKKFNEIEWSDEIFYKTVSIIDIEDYYLIQDSLFGEPINLDLLKVKCDQIFNRIDKYFFSGEFLGIQMSINEFDEFIKNHNKNGLVYIEYLIAIIRERYNIEYNFDINTFSKYKLLNTLKDTASERIVFGLRNNECLNKKFSIARFFVLIIHIIAKETGDLKVLNMINNLKHFAKANPSKKYNAEIHLDKKEREQKKPLCRDYVSSISTSSSIWTVRK